MATCLREKFLKTVNSQFSNPKIMLSLEKIDNLKELVSCGIKLKLHCVRMQEAVAVTTAIQEEIFLEMGIGRLLFSLHLLF